MGSSERQQTTDPHPAFHMPLMHNFIFSARMQAWPVPDLFSSTLRSALFQQLPELPLWVPCSWHQLPPPALPMPPAHRPRSLPT